MASRPISISPPLPYPTGQTPEQLSSFDQDLTRALWQYLGEMAQAINTLQNDMAALEARVTALENP